MKTVFTRSGFGEREKREDNLRKYSAYKKHNVNNYSYRKKFSNNSHNRHSGSSSHWNFNRSRDNSMKYNSSKMPYLMHIKLPKNTSQCSKEVAPWSEEALELERKQQVSDAANKLLNKLKMWSTEKDDREECDVNCNATLSVEVQKKSNEDGKGRSKQNGGFNHSEKVKNLSEQQLRKSHKVNCESFNKMTSSRKLQSSSSLGKSPRLTCESKQKKIHQNIIGELMTMPKENLNKVLVNPKIHPKIENKMAQIVKENRLILAQKFRHLAESKINSQFQFQSKFVDDVENLIDPDFAIDLCQLHPEIIKQMGDIFQLDFDFCSKSTEHQEDNDSCKDISNGDITTNGSDSLIDCSSETSKNGNRNESEGMDKKAESCHGNNSENMEIQEQRVGKISVRNFANCHNENQVQVDQSSVTTCNDYDSISMNECYPIDLPSSEANELYQNIGEHCNGFYESCSDSNQYTTSNPVSYGLIEDFSVLLQSDDHSKKTETTVAERIVKQENPSDTIVHHQNVKYETLDRPSDEDKRNTACLGSDKNIEKVSCEVQTDINLMELLHDADIHEKNEKSLLLQEVDMIDDVIHVLNQRRFLLFLKLVNLTSCNSNNKLKKKLMEAVTNCDSTVLKKKRKRNKSNILQLRNRREKELKVLRKTGSRLCQASTSHIEEEVNSDKIITEHLINIAEIKKECI